MRVLLLALGTTALTALVVSNAYYKKEQFYPTLVYLLNSNRSLGVLYLQSFVMLYLVCTLLKKIFFGTLRAAEVEVCEINACSEFDGMNPTFPDYLTHVFRILLCISSCQ